MAGDRTWIALCADPLDVGAAYVFLQTPAAGAIAVFVGTTRQWTGDVETQKLEYEAYDGMATAEMERLASKARDQWSIERICILHRLGTVPISEASVIVGVSAAHRPEAFAACRFLIDTLKKSVPIWKAEHYADGKTEWIGMPDKSG